ncbi:hypothetical protein [Methylophaga sp.]|uniref:hypothetical protein n=1 Tax=Methylophaga sp. TaxID=2024840 RepID=UPI003F69B837
MSWRSRLQLSTVSIIMTLLLSFFALGFAGVAEFIALAAVFETSVAAVITALSYVILALLLLIVTNSINREQKNKQSKKIPDSSQQEVDAFLESLTNPALAQLIKQHPAKTMIATVAAGVVVGYSAEAREMLKAFSQQCSEKKSD